MIEEYTFEERAAIYQYYSGFSKIDSEVMARRELFLNKNRLPLSEEKKAFERLGWSEGKQARYLRRMR